MSSEVLKQALVDSHKDILQQGGLGNFPSEDGLTKFFVPAPVSHQIQLHQIQLPKRGHNLG